jgi:hypothetical protein
MRKDFTDELFREVDNEWNNRKRSY